MEPGEWPALALSFAYFFALLACYYTLRPVRDALAAATVGASNLRYGFLATFLVMLALVPVFGAVASRLSRRRLVPVVYGFFILNIVALHWIFERYGDRAWLGFAFFVWLSVFNLFVVSVFWSFMADVFRRGQATRLFGPIAAGGSLGAIVGPLLTGSLVEAIGVAQLMWVSAGLLTLALLCVFGLLRIAPRPEVASDEPMGGGVLEGMQLAFRHPFLLAMTGFMVLGTMTGAMLYLEQAQVVRSLSEDPAVLAAFFARVDLAISVLAILIQVLLTSRLLAAFGFAPMLALLPVIVVAGFALLAVHPVLPLIVATQVLRRGTLFAITNPVSQMLFTAVGPHSKYKFKNFLDTAVYRLGDTTGSWLFAGILAAGGGLVGVSVIGAVAAVGFLLVSIWLGRRYRELVDDPSRRLP